MYLTLQHMQSCKRCGVAGQFVFLVYNSFLNSSDGGEEKKKNTFSFYPIKTEAC